MFIKCIDTVSALLSVLIRTAAVFGMLKIAPSEPVQQLGTHERSIGSFNEPGQLYAGNETVANHSHDHWSRTIDGLPSNPEMSACAARVTRFELGALHPCW
jgi:hypothetical protein